MLTTLLGGGMLLSDMKGFSFKLPNLASLKRLLPQPGVEEYPDTEYADEEFSTYAELEERTPVHHDLLPSERAPAAAIAQVAVPAPAIHTVRIEAEGQQDEALAPGAYDVHQPNLYRTELEEPDPEIDAVVAALAEEEAPVPPASPSPAVDAPEAAPPDADVDDLMSFFTDAEQVSKMPTTLTENLPDVSASDLLAEARDLRALLGHRDAA